MARILLVDADPASRDPLQRAVAREGLDVVVAGDPEAAWEAFLAFAPRAVVLGRGLGREGADALIARMRRADASVLFVPPAPPWEEMARRLRVRLGAPAPRHPPAPPAPTPGTDRVLSRPPLESGALAFGTLADLLGRLWRAAADGIVAVEGPEGEDRIFLLRGAPVAVRLPGRPAAGLAEAVAGLCASADGSFSFHPGADFAPEVPSVRTPALAPLLAGLRLAADEPSFAAALAGSAGEAPRRSAACAAVVGELELSADDAATVAAMDGTATLGTLLRRSGRPASLAWFLLRLGAALLPAGAEDADEAPSSARRRAASPPAPTLAAPGPLAPA